MDKETADLIHLLLKAVTATQKQQELLTQCIDGLATAVRALDDIAIDDAQKASKKLRVVS